MAGSETTGWKEVDVEESSVRLAERMLRAAILDVLRSVVDPSRGDGGRSIVDTGLVRHVGVDGNGARVELMLTSGGLPFAPGLVNEVRRRLEALPEVDRADVEVASVEPT
jgi:metal-sulfur cluster biosynthetic enzyme